MLATVARLLPPSELKCTACGKRYKSLIHHEKECRPCPPPITKEAAPLPSPVSESTAALATFHDALREDVASDLMDMRYQRGFNGPDIAMTKRCAQEWVDQVADASPQLLKPFLKEGVTEKE